MPKKTDHNRSQEQVLQARTLKAQAAFLREFALCGNVLRSCQQIKVSRSTIGEWRKQPVFEAIYLQAIDDAADLLEEEARRRAVDGVDEPVYYQGKKCGLVRKFSDAVLMFLLKGRRGDVFRDKASIEHSGPDGQPIQVITGVPQPHADRQS